MTIAEKVRVGQIPDNVKISIRDRPAHEQDAFCRVLLRSMSEAFKNPKFAADYEEWLTKRKENKEATHETDRS